MVSSKSGKDLKGEKGEKGVGFQLTVDRHFHLENKRLTNLAPPVDKNDAVTKGHLIDALRAKAGTNYVNKELAKKANKIHYKITKPANSLSSFSVFETPLDIKAGDRSNFHSKTTNGSVTHAIVNILIQIDI